jgi:hypothetical protein
VLRSIFPGGSNEKSVRDTKPTVSDYDYEIERLEVTGKRGAYRQGQVGRIGELF